MGILKEIFRLLCHRCPKCGTPLGCVNDNMFGYGLWYCPKCDGEIEKPTKDSEKV
jgi:ribosomal protein L37AE/L43A